MAGEMPGWAFYRPPLSVSAPDASGEIVGNGTAFADSTAAGAGGSPPYTYQWSLVSGGSFTVSGDTTDTALWSWTTNAPDNTSETWEVTVTDSLSDTASTTITVNILHT